MQATWRSGRLNSQRGRKSASDFGRRSRNFEPAVTRLIKLLPSSQLSRASAKTCVPRSPHWRERNQRFSRSATCVHPTHPSHDSMILVLTKRTHTHTHTHTHPVISVCSRHIVHSYSRTHGLLYYNGVHLTCARSIHSPSCCFTDAQAAVGARRKQADELAQFSDTFAGKMADLSGLQRQLNQLVHEGQ